MEKNLDFLRPHGAGTGNSYILSLVRGIWPSNLKLFDPVNVEATAHLHKALKVTINNPDFVNQYKNAWDISFKVDVVLIMIINQNNPLYILIKTSTAMDK